MFAHFCRLQIAWDGQVIVVFKEVRIPPPYKLDNVTGQKDSKQLAYVKKLMEKFLKDQPSASTEVTT